MGYGTSQQTVTTGAVFLPANWSRDIEIARESNKVMAGLVNRRDFDTAPGGSIIHIPFVSNLSTTAVSANTAVTFQAPTEAEVTVTLNRYYESSVAIEDRLDIQSKYDLATQYKKKIAEALVRNIDTDLTGLYSSCSQTTGTGMTSLTEANIARAVQYLNDAKAPMKDRHFVVAPSAMNQLQQISRFTDYQTTGERKAPQVGGNNGLVGNTFGVEVHMTTDIATVSGTPGIVHNLLFHKDAICLAVQKTVGVEKDRRPDFLATGYVASALWGFAELRDDHYVDVRTVVNT